MLLSSLDCDDLLNVPASDNHSCTSICHSEFLELMNSLEPAIRLDLFESAVPLEMIMSLELTSPLESEIPLESNIPLEYSDLVKPVNPDISIDPTMLSISSKSRNLCPNLPESSDDLVLHSRFHTSPSMGLDDSEDSIDVELRIEPDPYPNRFLDKSYN